MKPRRWIVALLLTSCTGVDPQVRAQRFVDAIAHESLPELQQASGYPFRFLEVESAGACKTGDAADAAQLAGLMGCVLDDRVMKTELAKQSTLSLAPATPQVIEEASAQPPKGTRSFVSYLGSDGISIALVVSADEHGVRALARRVHFD